MFEIGDKVKKITDGSVGEVLNSINTSSGTKYQVRIEGGETVYISEDILEPYQEIKTPIQAFCNFQFKGIDDFKRVLSFQRLSGGLTNMFYSMNNTLTKYLPHQFLPVVKFLQSPEERILIADEVGLGKTVEAMYIWKELEARRAARRLLVICPAALREKWSRDIRNLFGIHAEIVKADKLLETFHLIEKNRKKEQFAYICSIESIRTKKTGSMDTVGRLNTAFEEFASNYRECAFNLTIIDEAHYMRNRETANFKTCSRIRDISEALVLLSATPIQTGSDNLFSILNLLSPEHFDNQWAFDYMLKKDSIFIKLANCLQRLSTTKDDFENIIENEEDFESDTIIDEIRKNEKEIFSSPEKRMLYASELREQVFYNNYFNRTRRRFVFEDATIRRPMAVKFHLSPNEMSIYHRVSDLVKNMAKGQSQLMTFALIARQRQMSSCMPAAFRDWNKKLREANVYYSDESEENDAVEFDNPDMGDEDNISIKNLYTDLKPFYAKIAQEFSDVSYEDLKRHDSKFKEFLKSIKTLLNEQSKPKIIVFSFFRSTNDYLKERLDEEGISSVAIKGGMGKLKDDLLEQFRTDKSISVLISSEVGSEGLDLQFASVEYNYDLPWNPMRLEQRIGRIDRIGQTEKVLRIFNLYCEDTIEDRILQRLYERVKIFETSIGDMEDIVGQPVQDLALEIMDPNLTEEDIDRKAEQKIQVLINQRLMNNKLEEESGVLDEYRYLVRNSIESARNNKRCIDENERIFIIQDFLVNYFPGSMFIKDNKNPSYYILTLSNDAILSFRKFRRETSLEKNTSIDTAYKESILSFEPKDEDKRKRNIEIIDLDHPIFDWIKWEINSHPVRVLGSSAIVISPTEEIKEGNYIFYIQKWIKKGIEKATELKYFIKNVDDGTLLSDDVSEKILNSAITTGRSLVNPILRLENFEPYYNCAKSLFAQAWSSFDEYINDYKRKSKTVYNKQVEFVTFTANRKIKTLEQTIETVKNESKNERVIQMNEKYIKRIKGELEIKLSELEKEQYIEPEVSDIGIGVLIVE